MTRAWVSLALQITVSVLLLLVLARRVPFEDASAALLRVRPLTLLGAVALSLVAYWGRARRWAILLARAGIAIRGLASYRLTLVGTFYGLVTPGRIGEFARVLHLDGAPSATLPSVVWDRLADVLLLEVMSLPAFLFVPEWRGPLFAIYLALVVVTVAGALVLDRPEAARAAARVVPWASGPLARWSRGASGVLGSSAFTASLGWGVFFYVFVYTAAWLLLRDLAPGVSPRMMLAFPVIPLLGNLPIAFGGLGLREQVSAAVFSRFGASAATGAIFSLLWFTTTTLVPGVLGLVLSGPWFPREREPERAK